MNDQLNIMQIIHCESQQDLRQFLRGQWILLFGQSLRESLRMEATAIKFH